jgi:hypothetical protein
MRQPFSVELAEPDAAFTVVADSRDVRAWEAAYDESFLNGDTSFTKLAQLAHIAARRQGLFKGDYAAFDSRAIACEGMADIQDSEPLAANPTQSAVTEDSSAPLRSVSAVSHPKSKMKAAQ